MIPNIYPWSRYCGRHSWGKEFRAFNMNPPVRMICFCLACRRVLARDSGPEPQAGLRSEGNNKFRPQQIRDASLIVGKAKVSAKTLAVVGKGGSGCGWMGKKAHGKGEGGNGHVNSNGGAGKAKGPMRRCFRCKAASHYSANCTPKLYERCGGRGHEIIKCASPAGMDESPPEAVLVTLEDPGDDAVKTTSF